MRHLIACAMLAMVSTVHATQPDGLTAECSGTTFNQSWAESISLNCSGDLSLTGLAPDARLTAVNAITLRAEGRLSLTDLILQAPIIDISATEVVGNGRLVSPSGPIQLNDMNRSGRPTLPPAGGGTGSVEIGEGGDVSVGLPGVDGNVESPAGGQIQVGGGSIVVNSPGPVALTPGVVSAVPEPQTWTLLLGGLLALGGVMARRHTAALRR